MFRSLPPLLVDRTGDDKVGAIITSTVGQILALADTATPGAELMLGRLMELLFVEVLRRYAENLPAGTKGWFAAIGDPIVSRALQSVHGDPSRRWTVDDLAREAGASRTVLAERFNALLGQAPIEYVTGWRMQLAAERIRNSSDSLAAIAADIGYESEAAFNRAFKRVTGVTPGRFRDGADGRSFILRASDPLAPTDCSDGYLFAIVTPSALSDRRRQRSAFSSSCSKRQVSPPREVSTSWPRSIFHETGLNRATTASQPGLTRSRSPSSPAGGILERDGADRRPGAAAQVPFAGHLLDALDGELRRRGVLQEIEPLARAARPRTCRLRPR